METLSKRLHRLRTKKGYTIAEVAKLIEVSASTYRDWEYGREIKGEPYADLARALGVSLSYLVTGVEQSSLANHLNEIEEDLKKAQVAIKMIRALL